MSKKTARDLEDRLVLFSVSVIETQKSLYRSYAGIELSKQITRASISAALNYGEAQLAESRRDFVHKLRLTLKELKEIQVGVRICARAKLLGTNETNNLAKEAEELVAIFIRSVQTASGRLNRHPE